MGDEDGVSGSRHTSLAYCRVGGVLWTAAITGGPYGHRGGIGVCIGRLNYINGYVAKDHDAVDVGLGEYVQKGATAPWLASYRLLSKSTPCLPEVAIRMSQLSEFERSYAHVLLYPPQPGAMVSVEARKGNFFL